MQNAAKYLIKVYDHSGATVRRVFDSGSIISEVVVTREANKPCGEVQLELAVAWDDVGYGQSTGVNPYDFVSIYAITETSPNGILIFQGNVEEEKVRYSGGENRLLLRLFPMDAGLSHLAFLYAPGGTPDVTDVFTAASSTFNGATYYPLLTNNLAVTGVTLTIINSLSALNALNTAFANLDGTWYWRVRPDGHLDLQQYADSTPTHKLLLNRDIDDITPSKSLLDVVNYVTIDFSDGGGAHTTVYQNAPSVAAYGKRSQYFSLGTSTQAQSDLEGNNIISKDGDIFSKIRVTVNARYAIETILPGDTVKIMNTTTQEAVWLPTVLRVLRVRYDGMTAVLDLSKVFDNYGVELGRLISG